LGGETPYESYRSTDIERKACFGIVNPERVNYEKNPTGFFEWQFWNKWKPTMGSDPGDFLVKIFF
jgi:hypothetical protein